MHDIEVGDKVEFYKFERRFIGYVVSFVNPDIAPLIEVRFKEYGKITKEYFLEGHLTLIEEG